MKYIIHGTAGMKSNETMLSRSDERMRFVELDYLVDDIYCYSEFHAPCGAIIRQGA